MKHLTKLLAAALLALGLNQAVWADDASDFRETLQLAEQGVAEAQFNLGVMYENGRGVRQDYAEAAKMVFKYQAHPSHYSTRKLEKPPWRHAPMAVFMIG